MTIEKKRNSKNRQSVGVRIALGFLNLVLFYTLYFIIAFFYPDFLKLPYEQKTLHIHFIILYILYSAFVVYLGNVFIENSKRGRLFFTMFFRLYTYCFIILLIILSFLFKDICNHYDRYTGLGNTPNIICPFAYHPGNVYSFSYIDQWISFVSEFLVLTSSYIVPGLLIIVSIYVLTTKEDRKEQLRNQKSEIIDNNNQQTRLARLIALLQNGFFGCVFTKYVTFILCCACVISFSYLAFWNTCGIIIYIWTILFLRTKFTYIIFLFIVFSSFMRRIYALLDHYFIFY